MDQNLAALYGVGTGAFNRAILRNQDRFPSDFAFRLTQNEWGNLKCQIGISRLEWGGRRKLPTAFTEHGVAMAANLIKSKRAIKMSVEIVRAFIRLREFLAVQKEMGKELAEFKSFILKHSNSNDKEFRKLWDAFEKLSQPSKPIDEKPGRIGFNLSQ